MNKQEQQQVLDCVKELGPCGARKVAETLDMDWQDVRDHLGSLLADGFVKQQSNKQWVAVSTSKPAPGHPWKAGMPDEPSGPSVADNGKDGTLAKPDVTVVHQPKGDSKPIDDRVVMVNTATTDELIKQVKQGEKAREELRKRVAGLL